MKFFFVQHLQHVFNILITISYYIKFEPLFPNTYFLICHWILLIQKQSYRTLAEREFGWGGTSVITQHRCPKDSSVRTETSLRI